MRTGEEAEEQEEEVPEQEEEEDGESMATGSQKETAAEKAAGKLGNEVAAFAFNISELFRTGLLILITIY